MQEQDSYTLHKPFRKNFLRSKIIVYGIDDTWQADLIDIQKLASENKGNKFLLTVIDVFSKYAWVIPIKNKTNTSLIQAFSQIFKERVPKRLHTDQGTEFVGSECQKFLKQHGVQFYTLNSEKKASIVERFNRTLKEKMWRYFTKSDDNTYIDILDDLVYAYNHSYHRSIKMRPVDVKKSNQDKVFFNLYGYNNENVIEDFKDSKINFKVGDLVRLSKNKFLFDKGYTPNWTTEIFTITDVLLRDVPVYKIKDYSGEEIQGVFYNWELQKVNKRDEVYKIEKIIQKRKTKTGNEYLIKWLGYPSKFNSWVKEEDLK